MAHLRLSPLPRRLALAAALAGPLAAPAAAQQQAPQIGCILSVLVGDAILLAPPEAADVSPTLGPLPEGAVIRTAPDAAATILCAGGVKIALGGGSTLVLDDLLIRAPGGDAAIRLIEGAAGVVATLRGWLGLSVETPLAIASIRSTEWAVLHDDGASAVFVREGAVIVSPVGDGAAAPLGPGEGVDVTDPAADIAPPRRWGAARIEALNDRLGPGWN